MRYRIFEKSTGNRWSPTEVVIQDNGKTWGWGMRRDEFRELPAKRIEDVTPEMLQRPAGTVVRGSEILDAPDGSDPLQLLKPVPPLKVATKMATKPTEESP